MQTCTNEDLLRAALENRTSVVRRLLRAGADPRFRNDLPLSVAAKLGHVDIVRELLAAGANPSQRSGAAGSPLHWSAAEGRLDVVKLMLAKGANPNAGAETGQTPLHWACERMQVQVVRALLDAGADPNVLDQRRLSALHCACRQGVEAIVGMLLECGADPNVASTSGQTPLQWACADGNAGCIRRLLAKGAITAQCDVRGRTALHYAAEHGRIGAVKLLLATKLSPSAQDKLGSTPLHAAVFEGHYDVVAALVDAGANINHVGTDSMSPLILSAISSRPTEAPRIARLLLDAGARPQIRDSRNRTAISIAVAASHVSLVQALIDGGADPNVNCGFTNVVMRNNVELARVLLEGGVSPDYGEESPPLFVATLDLLPDMVSVLLHNGADPQIRDEQGFTPLGRLISLAAAPRSSCCRPDFLPVVATLLVAGASLADAYPPEYRDAYDARLGLQGIVKELGRRQRTALPNGRQMIDILKEKYARKALMQKL